MDRRLLLSAELHKFMDNVYYEPPENMTLQYDCIIYKKDPDYQEKANNYNYISVDRYAITVVERKVDTGVAQAIRDHFPACTITNTFVSDSLHHTLLKLYF